MLDIDINDIKSILRSLGGGIWCGAKTRSGLRCRNYAMWPSGRCRMHGGKSLRGEASPRWKHGKYSKYKEVKA